MDDDSIWQILIDTPQSFPDGLKFVALVIPPTMILSFVQVYFVCRWIRALIDLTGDAPTPETPGRRWFSWLPPRVEYPSQQFLPPLPPLPPVPPVPPLPRPQARQRQRQRQRRQGDRTETGKQGFPQTPPGLPKGPMCGVGED